MSSLLEDERVLWIRQRVVLALDIPIETFNEHFTDSLERARSAGIARENITDYFSSKNGNGSALFFSCKKWTEEVESKFLRHIYKCSNISYQY